MNYKLLFTTYRNRHNFVKNSLNRYGSWGHVLNLGTGEGDYDAMIAAHCEQLVSCDINERDLIFAKALNKDIKNIDYRVENALGLTFRDASFDVVVSSEVIEHVGQPRLMMQEIHRVLKTDGLCIMTYPAMDFPFTYDPINRILSFFARKWHISAGAYAFYHDYLIDRDEFLEWIKDIGFEVVQERRLSRYIVGLLEMYWTGIIQRIFKDNAANKTKKEENKMAFRPTLSEPALTKVTDAILAIDEFLFSWTTASIGKGFILKKK